MTNLTNLEETKAKLEKARQELDALIQSKANTNDQRSFSEKMNQLYLEMAGYNLIISHLSGRYGR